MISWTTYEGLFFCPDFMALNGVRIPDCVIGDQHMQFPMQRTQVTYGAIGNYFEWSGQGLSEASIIIICIMYVEL